jgi:predicted transglutaminase-like cysteine proteinase
MSKQTTFRVNPSFYNKQQQLTDLAEVMLREKLEDIAKYATDISPVDTGAYVTSHSFKTNTSSRGRGKTSNNKPKTQPELARAEGLNNLMQDLNSIDLKVNSRITMRNDSPHAQAVENGGPNWKSQPYKVYAQVKDRFRNG